MFLFLCLGLAFCLFFCKASIRKQQWGVHKACAVNTLHFFFHLLRAPLSLADAQHPHKIFKKSILFLGIW